MYEIMGKEIKDYIEGYVNRMKKVCKEVNKDYVYNYDREILLKGLNEIIMNCEYKNKERKKDKESKESAGYNQFLLCFMNMIYMACLDEDNVIRSGVEDVFTNNFYESLEKGFIKELSEIDEENSEEYIENAIYNYMNYIKLEINSFKFSEIDGTETDVIYSMKENGECRYFTYDLMGYYYDEFIKESKDYLMEYIKETLQKSLKIYRNKEKVYDYYENGRGREMIVRCSLYHIENPFDRYKKVFEKLENNDFSEFRKNERGIEDRGR